jgi:hypothetical protein
MKGTFWAAFALGLALGLSGVARADDDSSSSNSDNKKSKSSAATDAVFAFSSSHGILGLRELIDARCTDSINIRASLAEENESANFDSPTVAYYKDLTAVQAIGGVSMLGIADAGAKISLEHIVQNFHFHGQTWQPPSKQTGIGDLELAGKVTFKLGSWISLAPYGEIEVASGAIRVNHSNQWKLGGAGTFALLNDHVAVHGNLTFVNLNGGKLAFGYRLGASVAPLDLDWLVGRVVAYLDGLEYGRKVHGSDIRLAGGVQVQIVKLVTAEVTTEYKFVGTDVPRSVSDVSTFGVGVAAGVSFVF